MNLEFIGKGTYGIIMKNNIKGHINIIKQIKIEYLDDNTTTLSKEYKYAKLAYNINNDIFINIFKEEISNENLASSINIKFNDLSIDTPIDKFGYIHMEYMNQGNLYDFLKTDKYYDLTGILGCYINGLYILHNQLKIIHGDLTASNILVNYIGNSYRQKIIINNQDFYFDTKGYVYKIADFGLAETLNETKHKRFYKNHLYRDYLILYFIYFNKKKFYNYNKFINLIEVSIGQINDDLYDGYNNTDDYKKNFIDEFNYYSVCKFMGQRLESYFDNSLIHIIPDVLLNEYLDILIDVV